MTQQNSNTILTKLFFYLQKIHEKALELSGTEHVELMESLTHRQGQAFFIIGSVRKDYPEGMRIPEIAGYMRISSSAAVALVKEMEEKDLFMRVGTANDRVIQVTLSVLGTTIFELFNEEMVKVSEKLLNELPEELRANFIEGVQLLCRDFGE